MSLILCRGAGCWWEEAEHGADYGEKIFQDEAWDWCCGQAG